MLTNLYQRGDISFDEILSSCSVNIADREVLYYMLNRTSVYSAPGELPADMPGQDRAIIPDIDSNDNRSEQSASSAEPGGKSYTETPSGDEREKPEQELHVHNDVGTSDDITASGRSREELLFEIEKRLNEIEEKSRREDLLILGEDSPNGDTDITGKSLDNQHDQTDKGHSEPSDELSEKSDNKADTGLSGQSEPSVELSEKSDNQADTSQPGLSEPSVELSEKSDNQADTSQPGLSDQGDVEDIELESERDESAGESPLFDSSLLDLDYSSGAYQLPDPDKKKEERERGEESRVSEQESESGDESDYDLINRFLEKKPRISPARETDEKSYHDLAENQAEPPDLISETLARIYMSQKYYSKAIHIYEKLCLKYPEKSGYFATQIENIKELMS
jgi:hypothetical protein